MEAGKNATLECVAGHHHNHHDYNDDDDYNDDNVYNDDDVGATK